MKDIIQKEIAGLQKQAEELVEIREDVFNAKSDITITAVGLLLKKINESFDELLEVNATKEYYDAKLGATVKSAITDAINAVSKIKPPTVNVAVDLKGVEGVASEIKKQNDVLISLIGGLGNGKSDELHRLITAMIGKQNIFLEKGFTQADYTRQLNEISAGVNGKNERVERLTVKRDDLNLIKEVIPIYKKS